MTYEWSAPPVSLPNPQTLSISFYKPWDSDPDDAASATGTLSVSSSGPGGTPLEALNLLMDTLTNAGWVVQPVTASQEVIRTLEAT